jgi:hypothetical protein
VLPHQQPKELAEDFFGLPNSFATACQQVQRTVAVAPTLATVIDLTVKCLDIAEAAYSRRSSCKALLQPVCRLEMRMSLSDMPVSSEFLMNMFVMIHHMNFFFESLMSRCFTILL